MKKILLSIFVLCSYNNICKAQINLVLNPSFEQYTVCPDQYDEIKYCSYWMSIDSVWSPPDWAHDPFGVPDFCNICSTNPDVKIPIGSRYPRTGNGMTQVQMFTDHSDSANWMRDYVQGHLAHTLVHGKSYKVSFYVTSEVLAFYAVNQIAAYLDDGTIDTTHFPGKIQNQYIPQIIDTEIINDTVNWVKIEDTFIANGTEKLITIGQFTDRVHTHFIAVHDTTNSAMHGGFWAPYLIDDVSVIDCSNVPFAGNDTLITAGDSAWLGPHEILLPYTWYKLGSTTPIDSGGGTMVHPTVTTTYVLKQELCGRTLYDTMTVSVFPAGISNLQSKVAQQYKLFPNPNTGSFDLRQLYADTQPVTVFIRDLLGRIVCAQTTAFSNGISHLDVEGLENGLYLMQVESEGKKRYNTKFTVQK